MALPRKQAFRTVAIVVLAVCVVVLAGSYLSSPVRSEPVDGGGPDPNATDAPGDRVTVRMEPRVNATNVSESRAIRPGEEITVVATQGFYVTDEEAEVVAFNRSGGVIYHNDTYRVYFDVDPVPGTRYTVEYVAAKHLSGEDCDRTPRCTRNVVEQVNLTTGEVTRVYDLVTPRIYSARWHDVDRVNETHLVVADIVNDRVYVVDTRTDEITWEWRADSYYPESGGGKPGDWTHVNDVEVLDDGRIMASVRNFDQVVFLDRSGVVEGWSLGSDDDHAVLHEQHNPDYIPPAQGGPGVLVGDSENNRVVEYHRQPDGTWVETWSWRDVQLQWPRDADRLPDGNTLVVDSNGDRVMELTPAGRIVWQASIGMPYDAERLGTGDESAGGPAAGSPGFYGPPPGGNNSTGNDSTGDPSTGPPGSAGDFHRQFWLGLKDALPSVAVNGLLYVAPTWVQFTDLVVAGLAGLVALCWGGVELYWSPYRVYSWPLRTARSLGERARAAADRLSELLE